NEKDAIEKCKTKIPAAMRGLFGEPSLLEADDPNLYWNLLAAVIDERKPETASDWIALNDLVTKLWEERLLRQVSNALVRGDMIERLGDYLAEEEHQPPPQYLPGPGLEHEVTFFQRERAKSAKRWREEYYKKDPGDRPIASLLTRFGLTEAELFARAFRTNIGLLDIFERMIGSRERGRRRLRKEDERRRRYKERQKIATK